MPVCVRTRLNAYSYCVPKGLRSDWYFGLLLRPDADLPVSPTHFIENLRPLPSGLFFVFGLLRPVLWDIGCGQVCWFADIECNERPEPQHGDQRQFHRVGT